MLKQVESPTASPEELLRVLELELAGRRARRQRSQGQRAALLAGGLILVFAAATGALLIAFSKLTDLAARDRHPDSALTAESSR